MPKPNLTPEILTAALQGLEAQRARLDAHIAEVRRMLGAHARPQKPAAQPEAPKPKRRISAAARRRMAGGAKKRWAEYHRQKTKAAKTAKGPAVAKKAAPKRAAVKGPGGKAPKKAAKKVAVKGPKTTVAEAATQPAAAEGASE